MLILTGIFGLMLAGAAFVGLSGTSDNANAEDPQDTGPDVSAGDAATADANSGLTDLLGTAAGPVTAQEGHETDLILAGQAGPDLIEGDAGDDQIGGRDGDDTLLGAAGRDDLHGAEGDDLVLGGQGNDHLYGGTGDDSLSGGDGDDLLFGQNGDDTLQGGPGMDSLHGGDGMDQLFGAVGHDALHGGLGDDSLTGGPGNDTLFGGAGNDLLLGHRPEDTEEPDADYLNGGDGEDTIIAGSGDIVTGGRGADLFQLGHWITDPSEIMDFDLAEDSLLVVFDDTSGAEPLIELRADDGGSDRINLYLDGAHVASLSGASGLMLSDIVIMGQSQM